MSTEDTLLLPMAQQRGWGERSAVGPTTRDGTPPLAYGGGFAAVYRQQQPGAVVPWPDVCALIDMAEEALHAKSLKIEELANHESLVSADSGFLQEQVQSLLSDNGSMKERISLLERENRFLLEERDLMQEQLQQLAERLPSRQLHLGISTQGSETPFGTPCARDGEDVALPAGVPFRGFSTAADDSQLGTPSPFGSAMAQQMPSRTASSAVAGSPDQRGAMSDPESDTPSRREAQLAELRWRSKRSNGSSSPDDELIKSCGRRDETPFYTPAVRGFASARKAERQRSAPEDDANNAPAADPADQKAAIRLNYDSHQGGLSNSGTPVSSPALDGNDSTSSAPRDTAAVTKRQSSRTPDLEMAALNLGERLPARSQSASNLT